MTCWLQQGRSAFQNSASGLSFFSYGRTNGNLRNRGRVPLLEDSELTFCKGALEREDKRTEREGRNETGSRFLKRVERNLGGAEIGTKGKQKSLLWGSRKGFHLAFIIISFCINIVFIFLFFFILIYHYILLPYLFSYIIFFIKKIALEGP